MSNIANSAPECNPDSFADDLRTGPLKAVPDTGNTRSIDPDLDMARAFVKKLTGSADTVMRLKMLHDAKDPSFHPIEGAASLADIWPNLCAMQRDGYGVSYFLNEVRDMPDDEFAHACDIIAIRALAIDCDDGLPDTYHKQPPIIVKTSILDGIQRGQAIWPLKPGTLIEDFRDAQRRLANHYKSVIAHA
jgi:hypothetical protein